MRILTLISAIFFSFMLSAGVAAKGSTLVDGKGKPVKAGSGSCVKVAKSGKNDFFYSTCHKIKPKKV